MKRFDESKELLEASFLVEVDDWDSLNKSKDVLQGLNEHVKVSFLDNKGIYS